MHQLRLLIKKKITLSARNIKKKNNCSNRKKKNILQRLARAYPFRLYAKYSAIAAILCDSSCAWFFFLHQHSSSSKITGKLSTMRARATYSLLTACQCPARSTAHRRSYRFIDLCPFYALARAADTRHRARAALKSSVTHSTCIRFIRLYICCIHKNICI